MAFRVLGPLEAVISGRPSAPPGAKERTILARLLVEPGRPVATDALLDAAWPDQPHDTASKSLQVRLAGLRTFLEPERPRGAASTLLVRDGAAYRLAIDPNQVDAVRFERLIQHAATLSGDDAIASCDEALALWRGRPYAELPDAEFAAAEARRLEELRDRAIELRARARVETGRPADAIPDLERLARDHPHAEAPARALAIALYRSGRQVDALDVVRALTSRLRELGLDPSPETRALELDILGHNIEEAAPPAPAPAQPRRPAKRRRPPTSSFVGRDDTVAHVRDLLGDRATVTLVGLGGAGKTRLALEISALLEPIFPDGAWWCELAPLRTDDDVAGAIPDALGLDPGHGVSALAHATARIADRPGLLVLDNCEHVVEGAAAAAEELIAGCPHLRILATSRVPLGVDGEQVIRMTGLESRSGGAATTLFVDRARAAGAADDPAGHPEQVADICRRLDGLPLAIELAAGRTRSMTLSDIAARLDERLTLLKLPGRRSDSRHSTLRAAIDWSYELLDEPQRRVLERLSVFVHGATLQSAEDVCSGDGVDRDDIADILDSLVAHSLVTPTSRGGRTIYTLLETLREYAAEIVEARGETELLRDRHADHYVRMAKRLFEHAPREPRMPLIDGFEDVRAAVRWCIESDAQPDRAYAIAEALWLPALSAHGDELTKVMVAVVERWPDPHPALIGVLGSTSAALLQTGDAERAHRLAERSLSMEPDSPVPALMARRTLAQLAYFTGDHDTARISFAEISRLARAAGYDALAVEAEGFIVQVMLATGERERAVAAAADVRAEAARLDSMSLGSWASYVTGMALLGTDPGEARVWFERALEQANEVNYAHMARFSYRALGTAALLEGDLPRAAARLRSALEYGESNSEAATQRATLMNVAVLIAACGRHEDSAELLGATEGWPAAPSLASAVARTRAQVEQALTAQELEAATARGRKLDLESAKALARRVLRSQEAAWASELPVTTS
jgi:predicted ATPase/DNA-binding SARP family transcriptional activator